MPAHRKLSCGVALTMCVLLIAFSLMVGAATPPQEPATAFTGANSLLNAAAANTVTTSPATARTAHANSELAKRTVSADVVTTTLTQRAETSANRVSAAASEVKSRVPVAAPAATRGATTAEIGEASSQEGHTSEDYGPIVTGSVITGLVVVLCFSGVLTLLVLVEVVPHARRWIRACRGGEEKTEEELAAERAVEVAARERVEQALQQDASGKRKIEPIGGVDSSVAGGR